MTPARCSSSRRLISIERDIPDSGQEAVLPKIDESGRRILYVGEDLATSASEVFGEAGVAAICPRYRLSIVAPIRPLALVDLARRGAALAIGALPALADGSEARSLTQQWARAIFEDQPASPDVCGVCGTAPPTTSDTHWHCGIARQCGDRR